MMYDEKDLISRYKKEHPRAMWVDFQLSGNGVPDMWFYEALGVSWWVEFKYTWGDKLVLTRSMFRPQQFPILCTMLSYGQDVRVVLGNKDYYIEVAGKGLETELNRLIEKED